MQIHHIAVVVKNTEIGANFYKNVLGLEPVKRLTEGQNSNKGAWFRMGNTELHLQERSADTPKTDQHFALITDRFEKVVELAPQFGGQVVESQPLDGFSKRSFIYDPDKNRIELLKK